MDAIVHESKIVVSAYIFVWRTCRRLIDWSVWESHWGVGLEIAKESIRFLNWSSDRVYYLLVCMVYTHICKLKCIHILLEKQLMALERLNYIIYGVTSKIYQYLKHSLFCSWGGKRWFCYIRYNKYYHHIRDITVTMCLS